MSGKKNDPFKAGNPNTKGTQPNQPKKGELDPNTKIDNDIEKLRGALRKLQATKDKSVRADAKDIALATQGSHGPGLKATVQQVIDTLEEDIEILKKRKK